MSEPIRGHYSLTITELSMPDVTVDNIFPSHYHPRYEQREGRDGELTIRISVRRDADLRIEAERIRQALAAIGYQRQ